MATDHSTAFDFGGTTPSTFRCPDCGTTAPSTSVPYDDLGYAVCPGCSYTTAPETVGPWTADDA
ncbi:hypothetical protein [Halorubrum halodurans]|uniref:Small CPxCG-related zinc finger protein n=1 Tax=Halorubrum halodurans TaxID=1383851 RepID=A0A256IGQ6_9EURY|nr:hypothetical protein [Halorubrum halodurans]OYR55710.1 hypothetical protein DJ70_11420 [Halorubrum halodurans]